MPTSKETRVRVEGFSKIIASILPASGFSAVPAFNALFRRDRVIDDVAQIGGRYSREIEKVFRRSHVLTCTPEKTITPAQGKNAPTAGVELRLIS